MRIEVGKLMASLAKFRVRDGLWQSDGLWKSAEHVSPATWWKGLCSVEALSPVANATRQISPTSAASGRNWSLFGNIHTKSVNRLSNEKVEKLVAIRANLNLFETNEETTTCLQEAWAGDEEEASDSDVLSSDEDQD